MIRLPTHRNSVTCIYFTKLLILFFIFHLICRKVIDNDLFITYHGATVFLYLAGIDKKKSLTVRQNSVVFLNWSLFFPNYMLSLRGISPQGVAIGLMVYCPAIYPAWREGERAFLVEGLRLWAWFLCLFTG